MKTPQRLASGLVLASMMLSATPALAHNGEVHTSANISASSSTATAEVKATSKLAFFSNILRVRPTRRNEESKHSFGTGSGQLTASGVVIARHDAKIEKSLTMTARLIAQYSKKMCALLGNSAGTSLSTCMNDAKAKIKASFNAKIDAAFQVND